MALDVGNCRVNVIWRTRAFVFMGQHRLCAVEEYPRTEHSHAHGAERRDFPALIVFRHQLRKSDQIGACRVRESCGPPLDPEQRADEQPVLVGRERRGVVRLDIREVEAEPEGGRVDIIEQLVGEAFADDEELSALEVDARSVAEDIGDGPVDEEDDLVFVVPVPAGGATGRGPSHRENRQPSEAVIARSKVAPDCPQIGFHNKNTCIVSYFPLDVEIVHWIISSIQSD